jgi:small nuclear ribonucleoprotein (snRNP)-like protein
MAVSIPRAVIMDSVGQKITVETMDGATYVGTLESIDSTFNIRLNLALTKAKDGKYGAAGTITIPGSKVKLVALPPGMRNAPFFREVTSGAFAVTKKRTAGKKR